MRSFVTNLLERFARCIPLSVYPAFVRRDIIAFFCHAVSDEPMEHVRHLYPVVPVAQFEAALRYLKSRNNIISYEQLHAHHIAGAPLPSKAVHLSFDDGFAECFTVVRPLLRKYDIPCTFFIATDWLDNRAMFYRNKASLAIQRFGESTNTERSEIFTTLHLRFGITVDSSSFVPWIKALRLPDEAAIDEVCRVLGIDIPAFLRERQPYLTTAQIRQMDAEGSTIGAHTKTHRKLAALSDAEIESEIVDSCQIVREITGQEIVPFSFPHSAFGLDRSLLAGIRSRHPFIGLLFDTKGLRCDVDFIVNRIWAERIPSPKVGGGPGWGGYSLPELLHAAYQDAWVEGVMGAARKVKHF
ncbi:MAG: polysaccharide deacetylase family protein [Chloroflexota bacterium]